KNYPGKIDDLFLECNLSGDKKVNAYNFTRNRGKKVIAQVGIPYELVEKYLHTSPKRLCKMSEMGLLGSLYGHAFGANAQYANILTAIFIATGQDPACVAESACGITHVELGEGKLNVSVTLPGIMIGTIGGGTRLPTQKACLQILECAGPGNSIKLAEIVAAATLAGEISLIGAMAAGEFAMAHSKYGRH
ncbi:3-hydroxy-3-methylglutaryl-CoA reductase, partial [bacterium]|nr:3-hydroxy-3-methylglutaryl-CoA reductase [bacterium]